MRQQGQIEVWHADKGYGFLRAASGGQRMFAHITAFSQRVPAPQVGDMVSYVAQKQDDGKLRAVEVRYVNHLDPPKSGSGLFAWLLALLGLGGAGWMHTTYRLPMEYIWWVPAASLVTLLLYGIDKFAAGRGWRRTPEAHLHLAALVGGWPGALIAQQLFRHKTRKQSFRDVFFLTVLANIAAVVWWGWFR